MRKGSLSGLKSVKEFIINPSRDSSSIEQGRVKTRPFIFDSGPTSIDSDPRKGLVLESRYASFVSEYCSRRVSDSDNNPTAQPQITAFSNTATLELLRADDTFSAGGQKGTSVYSCDDLMSHAYPKWRNANELVQRHYHQKALRQLANATNHQLFTLNIKLSPELAESIIDRGGCAYLFDRLVVKLKRALGRTPLMWLILEAVTSKGQKNPLRHGKGSVSRSRGILHAHGAILLNPNEVSILRNVVASLNASDNPVFNSKQFESKLINDDTHWVEYCNKHRFLNRVFLNGMRSYCRSKHIAGLARRLYENDRAQHQQVRLNTR